MFSSGKFSQIVGNDISGSFSTIEMRANVTRSWPIITKYYCVLTDFSYTVMNPCYRKDIRQNFLLKLLHKLELEVWGLRIYMKYAYAVISSWGLIYPLSEHVDIFPVRLLPTFHWVFSVYLILAINLHSRLYPCGRNKTLGLDPSHLV